MSSTRPTLHSLYPVRHLETLNDLHYGQLPDIVIKVMAVLLRAVYDFDPRSHADTGILVLPNGEIQGCISTLEYGDDGLPEGAVWLIRNAHNIPPAELHRRVEAKIAGACGYDKDNRSIAPYTRGAFALGSWYKTCSGVWVLASDFQGAGLATIMIDHFGAKRFCYGIAAGAVAGVQRTGLVAGSHCDDVIPSVRTTPMGDLLGPDGAVVKSAEVVEAEASNKEGAAPGAWEGAGAGMADSVNRSRHHADGSIQTEPSTVPLSEPAQTLDQMREAVAGAVEAAGAKAAAQEGWQALKGTGDPSCVQPVESGACPGTCDNCPNGDTVEDAQAMLMQAPANDKPAE